MNDIGGIRNKIIKEYFEKINISKEASQNGGFGIFLNEAGEICYGDKSACDRFIAKFQKEKKVAKTSIDPKHNEKVSTFKTFKKQGLTYYGDKEACDKLKALTVQVEDRELI